MSNYIFLQGQNDQFFSQEENSLMNFFGPINSINLLIGANNSRKSRFLRTLIEPSNNIILSKNPLVHTENLQKTILDIFSKYTEEDFVRITIKVEKGATRDFENYKKDLQPIIDLINSDNNRFINIDNTYFKNLIKDINNFIKNSDIQSQGLFNTYLLNNIILMDFLIKFHSIEKMGKYNLGTSLHLHFKNIQNRHILDNEFEQLKNELIEISKIKITSSKQRRIYIPTLRSAISLYDNVDKKYQKIKTNIFQTTIDHHYSIKDSIENNLEVFTGLDLYQRIKKDRNSKRAIRERFNEFENFLKDNFFHGSEIDIVAVENEDPNHQHIEIYLTKEKDRYIHDLGDGIQALINLIYPIFMAEQGSWVFIEEPELNMHPGLQHLFLESLASNESIKKKDLKFFITTHSNHLLNLSLTFNDEISIFSFEKKSTENISVIRNVIGNDIKILDLLGVYNASVFMSNCSIWVEGVTDRRYLQAFLKAYIRDNRKEQLHEDIQYSFFEYSGSNLKHYLFNDNNNKESEKIKGHFLANRIFLLADQDSESDLNKQEKHKEIKKWENYNFTYKTTGVVEVENLISGDILKLLMKKVLKVKEQEVIKLELLETEFKKMRMGEYITLKTKNRKNITLFSITKKGGTGTLTTDYKNKFSQAFLKLVNENEINWEMISKNSFAKKLTEDIYSFIERHNASFKSKQ